MPYKKKIILLGSAAAALALVYGLTLFFDPARVNTRNAYFTWLPAGAREEADRIEIFRGQEKLELVLRNGQWAALLAAPGEFPGAGESSPVMEVPVKQGRVDDLFRILETRGAFPRRGSSPENHADLGLTDNAARLVIRGGAGLPLLDLLVGRDDASGKEVFLRRNGENVFRSGNRLIGSYVNGQRSSWYDLRLFEEVSLDLVQKVQVNFTGAEGVENFGIVRSGENWNFEGGAPILDRENLENWIRGILEAQGEDFRIPVNFNPRARISLELGNGSVLLLQIGETEEDKSPGLVSGKPYLFVLPQWTVSRLLRDQNYFR
ncbi:MAG: DUF4340 domain-containing protein [Spirochaetaceae bacterium]|jgi:hypothetical protein|nr:DUF4340 domain-containing protein [Spirochaetaceae bacterium]